MEEKVIIERLKSARKINGMTLLQVADKIGKTNEWIRRVECGIIPVNKKYLPLFSKIYFLPIEYFTSVNEPVVTFKVKFF